MYFSFGKILLTILLWQYLKERFSTCSDLKSALHWINVQSKKGSYNNIETKHSLWWRPKAEATIAGNFQQVWGQNLSYDGKQLTWTI